jgi:hypothetical protein
MGVLKSFASIAVTCPAVHTLIPTLKCDISANSVCMCERLSLCSFVLKLLRNNSCTNSLEKALSVVNPTIGGGKHPLLAENFWLKTTLRPSPGRKGIAYKISLHLVVSCPNA